MCRNDLIAEYPGPNNKLKAVVFQRECGATTDFSTQVSLISIDESLPDQGGNLFAADTDHGRAPAIIQGGPEVRIKWEGPHRLVLGHHVQARIFLAEKERNEITVSYRSFQ